MGYANHIERKYKIHPKMFLLYLSMASMVMLFSSLSSALIVKKGDVNHWQNVALPNIFLWSTLVIILSSVTIQLAYNNRSNVKKFQLYALITLVLGIVFLMMQYRGWSMLTASNVLYTGNPSGSFIYFISGVHGFHYIFGILFLFLLYRGYSSRDKGEYLNFKILTHYWHFIGLVWVYLFIFFKFIIYK